jgi:hypothetical protein
MFRKILHKGNYKYKKEDFIVEPKKYVKMGKEIIKVKYNPWST